MTKAVVAPVPVIAIGSSADGVLALREIVAALPADLPAAVIIVQHLANGREPRLPAVLARTSALRMRTPEDGEALARGTVYVARPGVHHLSISDDGTLRVEGGEKVTYARPSIDVLFASVARVCGERGAGVLLSGASRDGAAGLAEIRKAGGVTIVQDPDEARYPRMPMAALALDGHEVLQIKDIGPTITRMAQALARRPGKGDA